MQQKHLKKKKKKQRGKRNNMVSYAPFLFDERGNQLDINMLIGSLYDLTFIYRPIEVTVPLVTKQEVEDTINRINSIRPTNVVKVSQRIMSPNEIEGLERRFGISVD